MIPNLWHLKSIRAARAARARARAAGGREHPVAAWEPAAPGAAADRIAGRVRGAGLLGRIGRPAVHFGSISTPGLGIASYSESGSLFPKRSRATSASHHAITAASVSLTTNTKTVRATALSLSHFPRAAEYSRLHHHAPLPRVRLPEANPRSTRASARFAPFSSTATLRRRAAPAAAARGCAERHALPPGEARAAAQVLPRSGAVLRRAVLLEEP